MKILNIIISIVAILFVFSVLFTSCTICPSEDEFYSILLNGSWIPENEKAINCTQILTFYDMKYIKQIFPEDRDTLTYHYSINKPELELYSNNDEIIARYKIDIVEEYNKIKITRVDSVKVKNNYLNSFVGAWKRYQ